jgi:formate transporter
MSELTFDALPPASIARKAEQVGETKTRLAASTTFALAVLAGAFIAMGAIFSTTTMTGGASMPYGVTRLLGGITFSLGLILVVVAGAELFTGNNLIVMAWAGRRVSTARVLRNWSIVWVGNFVGALATAGLMIVTKQYTFDHGEVGVTALAIATAKCSLGWWQAVALGMFCNALVCLAVWLAYSARSTADKVLAIIPPIAAFVASGFEHCVANMYFIPYGLFIKSDHAYVGSLAEAPKLANLTWGKFIWANLIPVTLGNVIGGALMVGAIYWFVYLRRPDAVPQ